MARLLQPWADSVLVLPSNSRVDPTELSVFTQVVRIPMIPIRKSILSLALYVPALIVGSWRLRSLLAREKADILIINDFNLMHGAVVRLFGFKGRIITWVRFDPSWFPRLLARSWLGIDYRISDAVVAVSDFIATRVPASPKLHRIYDAIDTSLAAPSVSDRPKRDLVYVGNYIQGKGQDHAVEAFGRIAAEFPDARLVFHGGDMGLQKNRDHRRKLEVRATKLAGGRIVFNGFATDIAAAFQNAIGAINLSESESFSLVCLEASQLGIPVIAFRSGGPEEIIVDDETGYLCKLGDIDAVATAMRALLANPERAALLGEAAAAHVRERFGPEAYIAATRRLFGF